MSAAPLFISVAPNGARKTQVQVPAIPITPEELAIEAKNCRDAGVALFHLHVRDDEQKHILDVGRYRAATEAIREAVGNEIIVQVTTEAVGMYSPEQQMELVRALKPEAISMAVRELIPDANHEAEAKEFFAWVKEENIFAQYILYTPEEVRYFATLREKGIIAEERSFILFVLGKKQAPMDSKEAYARPADLTPFVTAFNETMQGQDVSWAVCAFGGYENDCMVEAVRLGGNVRIGFENNHLMASGEFAPSNAALIQQFTESVKASGRTIATAGEMRDFFQGKASKKIAA